MTEQDVKLVRHVIELNIRDVLPLLSDDLVLELPFRHDGGPRVLRGEPARLFLAGMADLFSRLDFYDVVVHGQLPSGTVVAEYRSNGRTRAGRAYSNAYVALLTVRDRQVATWREYFDPTVVSAAFSTARAPGEH